MQCHAYVPMQCATALLWQPQITSTTPRQLCATVSILLSLFCCIALTAFNHLAAFCALLVVICGDDYKNEDSKTVGHLPVYLVRTGIEDGLSAPITFESIADKIENHLGDSRDVVKTTLETAVDFVMGLEAREAAVFGLQPDPDVLAQTIADEEGDELLRTPSSKFVSDEKAQEWGWSGDGEDYDSRIMPQHERRAFHWDVSSQQRMIGP